MVDLGSWYPLEPGSRLRIVDVVLQVEGDVGSTEELGGFTLAQTGTLARQLLGDAIETEGEELAFLEVVDGPERGERFPLPDELESRGLGGTDDCIVHLSGGDVADRVATIAHRGNGFALQPTGQTPVRYNGTELEGEIVLTSGDRLAFEGRTLRFHDPLEEQLQELENLGGTDSNGTAAPSQETDEPSAPAEDSKGDSSVPANDAAAREEETGAGWGLVETALLLLTLLFVLLVAVILLVTFEAI